MEEGEQRQINTLIFFRSCKFSALAAALAATGPRWPAHATDGSPLLSIANGCSEPSSSISARALPGIEVPQWHDISGQRSWLDLVWRVLRVMRRCMSMLE